MQGDGFVRVTGEILADGSPYLYDYVTTALDRQFRPWLYPDRPAIRWTFEPFPRLVRAGRWFRHGAEA